MVTKKCLSFFAVRARLIPPLKVQSHEEKSCYFYIISKDIWIVDDKKQLLKLGINSRTSTKYA